MQTPRYDLHQFYRLRHPVHVRYVAGQWESTGISFEDLPRYTVQNHKPSAERKLPTPQWAVNDSLLRELLVTYLEHRAGINHKQPGTQAERLARATAKLKAEAQVMAENVIVLNREYAARKRIDPRDPILPKLAIEIENMDTSIRFMRRPAEMVCGVVYYYFRAKENSCGSAQALGLKPPHVRQVIWRLSRTWQRMMEGTAWRQAAPPKERSAERRARSRSRARATRIMAAYKEGKSYDDLKAMFGAKAMSQCAALAAARK